MYGFVIFVASTAVLIFAYATEAAAGIWPVLWHLGALMLCFGGYWFWFFIRVDVAAEGVKWYNFNGRGDIFIVGLITMPTFALLWSATLGGGALNMLFFVLFIACSTVLFGSVFWSKRIRPYRQNFRTSRNIWAPIHPTWGPVSTANPLVTTDQLSKVKEYL
jgi:hypothetical protein